MSYSVKSRPTFDASAAYVATGKLKIFNGTPMSPGDLMPALPKDKAERLKFSRDLRQLLELRWIALAPIVVDKTTKLKKEKP